MTSQSRTELTVKSASLKQIKFTQSVHSTVENRENPVNELKPHKTPICTN